MKLGDRMSRLGTESAFEVLAKARLLEQQGKNIIHLEIGEPDFPTPRHVVEAGKRALDEGWTKYGPTGGLPELREVIALGQAGRIPPIPLDIRPLDAAPQAMADLRAGRVRGRVILKPAA